MDKFDGMRQEDFPILSESVHGRKLVYLDNAATTQKPQVVLDAIAEAYSKWNANVHRGVHHLSQVATQKHEEAREKVAELIPQRRLFLPKVLRIVSICWRAVLAMRW